MINLLKIIAILFCFFTMSSYAGDNSEPLIADSLQSPESWRRPVAPFQIADHTWYISSEGLSAVLIKTDEGAILIDGGMPGAEKMLLAHISELGVAAHDLKWILLGHAHFDHAGPLAEIRSTTSAQVATNAESATLLARGGK